MVNCWAGRSVDENNELIDDGRRVSSTSPSTQLSGELHGQSETMGKYHAAKTWGKISNYRCLIVSLPFLSGCRHLCLSNYMLPVLLFLVALSHAYIFTSDQLPYDAIDRILSS